MNSIVEAPATMTSTELLEIVNEARKEFGESELRNNVFVDRIKDELEGEAYKIFVSLRFGKESETIELTQDQCMLVAMRESKGVRRKVLAKLKKAEPAQLKPPVSPPALADLSAALEVAARMLNVCESSKLQMLGAAFSRHGVDPVGLLPSYAVDAPAGHVTAGSSLPAFSLTHLLKEHGIPMSAIKANKALEQAGLLEAKQRASTKAPDKLKTFWALTGPGLQYGKNAISPSNPRETQPLFFAERFPELLDLIETRH
ncbi:MAG: hypothetical protein A2002_04725 [Pseudomonadales bacterium GWC1_66_9]|nr:MAG: hypothetical protein A2002_04725 [Pseudomonadales bacterium GWC1_66_9]